MLKTQVNIDFSYKLTLNNEATIYLGLKGGLNSFKANTKELVAYNKTPDLAKTNLSRINPNISVGLIFKHKTSRVSAALPRLFNIKRSNEIFINARDRVHFYFAAGTAYPIKENFQLEPRLIYRTVQGIKSTVEKALWANYKQRFSFGIGLRTGAATSFK